MAPFEILLSPPSGPQFVKLARDTLMEWAKAGCTTIFDAGIGIISPGTDVDVRLLDAVTSDKSPSVRYMGALTAPVAAIVGATKPPYQVNANFQICSIKLWADGSTQGFTGAVREPYIGNKGWGVLNSSDGDLRTSMALWQSRGWQILVHSNGDRATDQVLGAYHAVLQQQSNLDPKMMHRIEHATVISQQQLLAAKALNLGVTHLIGYVYYWGHAFRTWILGSERAERIDPVQDDIEIGLVYSFHSDSPVTPVQPLLYAQTAATRTMYKKSTDDVLGRSQRITVIEALRGITTNAAKHVMLEDHIGSLEEGKSADMVVLGCDPTKVDALCLASIPIHGTWLKGKKVW